MRPSMNRNKLVVVPAKVAEVRGRFQSIPAYYTILVGFANLWV